MLRYLILIIILFSLTLLGCEKEVNNPVLFAGDSEDDTEQVSDELVSFVGGSEDQPYYSEHHIDGWLSDYECVASLDSVNDVLRLGNPDTRLRR